MSKFIDLRFQHPHSFLLAGASKSGKTFTAVRIIQFRKKNLKNAPKFCYLYYSEPLQPIYKKLQKTGFINDCFEGLPKIDFL